MVDKFKGKLAVLNLIINGIPSIHKLQLKILTIRLELQF